MDYYDAPIITQQGVVHNPITQVFEAMCNPKLVAHMWLANSDDPIVEGQTVRLKWPFTDEVQTIVVQKIVPHKIISTLWIDSNTVVDYHFFSLDDERTLVSLTAHNFDEQAVDFTRIFDETRQAFQIALVALKEYFVKRFVA